MVNKPLTRIGLITGAHGIRGQVKIRSFLHDPESLFSCDISDAEGQRRFALKRTGGQAPHFIAAIDGITDRNAAEALKNSALYAPTGELPEEERLVGLEARLSNGSAYGRVIGLYNFGAGDIIEIEKANGDSEMLPLNDAFAQVKDGFVEVFPPEYVEAKK